MQLIIKVDYLAPLLLL